MRTPATVVGCAFILIGMSARVSADSCLQFLTENASSVGGTVHLVTMNKNGVASFSTLTVDYRKGGPAPSGGVRPPQWFTHSTIGNTVTDTSKQLFSDRVKGPAGPTQQPFDVSKPDDINVVVSVEASPQVSVTLRTWGNAKATFRATCSAGGVMHGSTPDVDYLLLLGQSIVK